MEGAVPRLGVWGLHVNFLGTRCDLWATSCTALAYTLVHTACDLITIGPNILNMLSSTYDKHSL